MLHLHNLFLAEMNIRVEDDFFIKFLFYIYSCLTIVLTLFAFNPSSRAVVCVSLWNT